MYYGGGSSRAIYYGGASRPVYYGGGGAPAAYAGSGYGGAYYYGGVGSGGEEDDSLMGAVTIGRMLRVCTQRWVTIAVFVIIGFIVAFAVFKISPMIYEAESVFEMSMRRPLTRICGPPSSMRISVRPWTRSSTRGWPACAAVP
jgi:hypothetical protein